MRPVGFLILSVSLAGAFRAAAVEIATGGMLAAGRLMNLPSHRSGGRP
jgi:hypothetical protein